MTILDRGGDVIDDDFVFYSLLYSSITLVFAMAVLTKFLTHEFRFGFRSVLSLGVLFIGEPLCHLFLRGPSGLAIFGMSCLLIYSILPANHLPVGNKAVLITGCDSGFGHELVQKLDSIGMTVFAGCLYKDGPGAIELRHSCSSKMKILQLDVTKKNEIEDALQFITQQLNGEGLWGLVNNAGIWYAAELDMTSEKVFREVTEVNLMGTFCVTKAFLPLIRKAQGRIVNVSSVTGKVPFECLGAYCVSKHALEAYTDVLRLEMKKWGVIVSLVQPSGYKTGGTTSNMMRHKRDVIWRGMDEESRARYGRAYFDRTYDNFESAFPRYPGDLTPVIRALSSGLLSMRPREKFMVGSGVGTFLSIYPLLPVRVADYVSSVLGFSADKDMKPAGLQNQ